VNIYIWQKQPQNQCFFVLKNIHEDEKFHDQKNPLHEFLYFYSFSFPIPKKMFPLAFRLVEVMETCQDSYDYIFYIEKMEIMFFATQVLKVVISSNAKI
jgi:hypothetical protein